MENTFLQILELAVDSSEDEVIDFPLPNQTVNAVDDTDDYDVIRALEPILDSLITTEHIKINSYIETTVRNYISADFLMHFRLSRVVAYQLISRFTVSPTFTSLQVHAGYTPMTPEKHVLCYLWFVGHESGSYRDVSDRFGISLGALHKLISRVTGFLISIAPTTIRFPTIAEREVTKQYYLREKRFPGIIGSIDGSHIRIDKPVNDKDSYINRKQYFSLHMQGIVNQDRKFMDVFIGYPGSVHDARVFAEWKTQNSLEELCGEDGYLLGDSAYPCLKHMIVPYRDNGNLTRQQANFNRRLSSCRVIVENAFGCLKQRFRQLYHCKLRDIVRMVEVIHACCVLHNLANSNDLETLEPPIDVEHPDPEAGHAYVDTNRAVEDNYQGRNLRDELCHLLAMQ